MRASLARPPWDLSVGVIIFVDEFGASGPVLLGSQLDLSVYSREVWRDESIAPAVEFEAILLAKPAPAYQCASRKNAW